ncbi:MAG: alpha/beta fold hydrolase [Bacteroidota bacterium]
MKLNFRKIGESGQPIIILHGLFGMSDNWLTISKFFAINHLVYILDLRNHGQSPQSDEFGYQEMADDLAELIVDQKLEKPILIGHSMGGKVIMQFAIDHSNLADKLIIVDIAPKFYPVHHTSLLQGLHTIQLENLQSRTEANDILKRFEESEGVRQFLLKNLYRNPETSQFGWRFNLPVLTREIANIGQEINTNQQIINKTLFIYGSESSYILEEDFAKIKAIFLYTLFKEINGAGHWVQADKPKEFVETVLKFID